MNYFYMYMNVYKMFLRRVYKKDGKQLTLGKISGDVQGKGTQSLTFNFYA